MGEMSKTATDMIITMAMDMMNDPKIDNGRVVRACLFGACLIAITHKVPKEKLIEILEILHKRISLSIGLESMFPPAES